MLTMSHLWKCVLFWCGGLLIFPEIVTSLSTCLRSGECLSGFYCHTGSDLCLSCDKCSDARGNLHLCEKECTGFISNQDVIIEADSSTRSKPMIVAIVAVAAVLLVAVIVALICWRHRSRAKLGICVPETGDGHSQNIPTITHPLVPECASPDESLNHHSFLLPINAES